MCDLVYVIYWNPVNSTFMKEAMGEFHPLALFATEVALSVFRQVFAEVDGIFLVDMFGALGNTLLDPYLIDEAHPNDAGHQLLYADMMFRSVGGVLLEPGTVQNRLFGFYAKDLRP